MLSTRRMCEINAGELEKGSPWSTRLLSSSTADFVGPPSEMLRLYIFNFTFYLLLFLGGTL